MICCRSPAARGYSEDGSSECLYCSFPGWSVFLAGPPRPRIFTNGGSTPGPRVTFVRTNVTKRRWGDPRPPLFIQSVCIEADTSQPPNYHTLRASDLRRVSGRTSAVALLKGQANLIFCVGPPAPIGPYTGFRHPKNRNVPYPEGRQAKCAAHRTDYEGPAAPHRLSGCAEFLCRRPIGLKKGVWGLPSAFW